jgi:hypothetical protein
MPTDFVATPPSFLQSLVKALGPNGNARVAAGLAQGIALYLLYRSSDAHVWPSTDPYWLAALSLVFIYVPVLYIQAVGSVRNFTLAIWLAGAAIVLAGLAWHDIWRQSDRSAAAANPSTWMSFALLFFTAIGLFIAQSLVAASDAERKYIARYGAYFDAAWKLGVQVALTFAFVAVFWGVLWLGAVLFSLIELSFIETLIEKSWFAIPATTLAVAGAIHITDVRVRLVTDIRGIVLSLLSWLLPLMTLIAFGFIASLVFTGLAPLWATRRAAAILLTAVASLVVLINATYQNGEPTHRAPFVLRYAEFLAALALVPISVLAGYALGLRIDQYGLTVERIATAACVVMAFIYAIGYATAAITSLRQGTWMQRLEAVNIWAAFAVLAILLFLFSPVGDPARISVDNQMARLASGNVAAADFDYDYLNTDGGRYGRDALHELMSAQFGAKTALVRKAAEAALAGHGNLASRQAGVDIGHNVTVYPTTRELPRSLLTEDWSRIGGAPACLTTPQVKCDAFFADLDGDGSDELILTTGNDTYFWGTILQLGADEQWKPVGTINGHCAGMLAALKRGDASVVPSQSLWRDWVVMGVHLHPARTGVPQQPCPRQF